MTRPTVRHILSRRCTQQPCTCPDPTTCRATTSSPNVEGLEQAIRPVDDHVPLERYVEQLNRVSRERSLGVSVSVRTYDGTIPFVRFEGPTGEHGLRFIGVDGYTPLARLYEHAHGFFDATQAFHARRAARLLETVGSAA